MKTLKERILDDVCGFLINEVEGITRNDIFRLREYINKIQYGDEGNEINVNIRVTHMPDIYIREKKTLADKLVQKRTP